MALSGSFYIASGSAEHTIKMFWEATQNISANTSTIRTWVSTTYSGNTVGTGAPIVATATTYIGTEKVLVDYKLPIRKGETITGSVNERTVKHNNAGNLTIEIGISIGTGMGSGSQSITLNRIIRPVGILTAPNFNDEANPTITYRNYMGSSVSKAEACISLNGDEDIKYRVIDANAGSYTFELTEEERKLLRAATVGSNARQVRFFIRSTISGYFYYSNVARTYTIINGSPVFYPTIKDTDINTLFLTEDENVFVKYYSDAYIESNAGAVKEATLKSYTIANGAHSEASLSASFQNVETGTFTFTATDSRGNTTTQTVEKPFINYIKLTCNLDATAPTTAGTARIKVSGNYFNGSFGAKSNVLILHCRYKVDDKWSEWLNITPTITNNTYSIETEVNGLNYRKPYTFQARAADMLETIESNTKTVRTTPIFDWGENDFQFNVPVRFNAGMENHNVLLWQGAYFMTANQTATLATPISAQNNGIVLVFSNYDTTNKQANDYDWHCFFVPKYLVDIKDGTGHCFNMMSQSFGDICSKYIYISDTGLTGHDNNTKSATNNGINYSNAKYVMRYVFGV